MSRNGGKVGWFALCSDEAAQQILEIIPYSELTAACHIREADGTPNRITGEINGSSRLRPY